MPAIRKILLLIFSLLVIALVILLVVYFKENKGCITSVSSLSNGYNLKINEEVKWQNFIDTIGNCNKGNFTIFDTIERGVPKPTRKVEFVLSDEEQSNSIKTEDGSILYSYSISYGEKRNARVILNYPEDVNINENTITVSFLYVSYYLFNGQPYLSVVRDLLQFKNLDSLGLLYEDY